MPLGSPRTCSQDDDLRIKRALYRLHTDNALALTDKAPNETSFNNIYAPECRSMCVGQNRMRLHGRRPVSPATPVHSSHRVIAMLPARSLEAMAQSRAPCHPLTTEAQV